MKSVLLFLLVFLMVGFTACIQGRMDTGDVVPGTPSYADTVIVPRQHHINIQKQEAYDTTLPRVYWR